MLPRLYKIRQIGTESYLLNRKVDLTEVEFGSFTRSLTFTRKQLIKYLNEVYKHTSADVALPDNWEIAAYDLIENNTLSATSFLQSKSKTPLLKL